MKIVLEKGQRLYFTSDTHYNHSNICSATTTWVGAENLTRKFNTLNHMNDALVNNINEVVGENDVLVHLGDWSFGGFEKISEFRNRIICKKIHLTYGNHDHHIRNNKEDIQEIFSTTQDYLFASWDSMNDGVIHLHGHVHLPPNLRLGEGKSLDVGVDGNNLHPMSLDEILSVVKNQPIRKLSLPKDHHEKRI